MMIITKEFLKEKNACMSGYEWFLQCGETEHKNIINKLMREDKFNWANWLIVRIMTHEQQINYVSYAVELVLNLFEDKYPDDKRPRKAIEAAKAYLSDKNAAYTATATAVYAAAADAAAADAAAYAAAYAAAVKSKIIEYGLNLLEE